MGRLSLQRLSELQDCSKSIDRYNRYHATNVPAPNCLYSSQHCFYPTCKLFYFPLKKMLCSGCWSFLLLNGGSATSDRPLLDRSLSIPIRFFLTWAFNFFSFGFITSFFRLVPLILGIDQRRHKLTKIITSLESGFYGPHRTRTAPNSE